MSYTVTIATEEMCTEMVTVATDGDIVFNTPLISDDKIMHCIVIGLIFLRKYFYTANCV